MTVRPVFRQALAHAATAAGKPAIVCGDRSLTYGELNSSVQARAAVLARGFAVEPGDRVVLAADPDAAFVATYLAIHCLGAVCVPLDVRLPGERLVALVERLAPKVSISREPLPRATGQQALYDELATNAVSSPVDAIDVPLDRAADILLTTGTTADAKAVVLSHRALAAATGHINRFIGTRPDAIEVLALALNHSFGLGRMRCVLSLGATLVLVPGFLDAGRIVDALASHRATGFAAVPAGIAMLLTDGGARLAQCANRLEYLELGSAAMPAQQKLALMSLLPSTRICMHYGLTEASRSAFISFHDERDRLESIGRPSPGVEMRIVGPAGGVADLGATGRIEIRGDHLMSGYWQNPDLTAESLHDGWLRTGDIGRADSQGYFYLESRVDDVINVGGRKVLPQEIEEVLLKHPAIAECACVGIPDPQGLSGEIISAWLVPKRPDAALPEFSELAKLLRQKLEPYKTPRRFRWTDCIPKTPSGKVLRQRMRELQ